MRQRHFTICGMRAVALGILAIGLMLAGPGSLDGVGDIAAYAKSRKSKLSKADAEALVASAAADVGKGRVKRARDNLDRAIASKKLGYRTMAKALYQRGLAHAKAGDTPKAIEDLTAALWIKNGLSTEDRNAALKARASVYASAGLTSQPGVAAAVSKPPDLKMTKTATRPARPSAPARAPAAAANTGPVTAGWAAETKSADAGARNPFGSVGRNVSQFFNGLLTGSTGRRGEPPPSAEPTSESNSNWRQSTWSTD